MTPILPYAPGTGSSPPGIIKRFEELEQFLGKDSRRAFEEEVKRTGAGSSPEGTGLLRLKGTIRLIDRHDPERVLAETVGRRVRFTRHQRGWTQQQLADASGIKRPNISRLEAGRHDLRVSTVQRVAKALGLAVGWLLKPWEPTVEDLAELRGLTASGERDLGDSLARLERED